MIPGILIAVVGFGAIAALVARFIHDMRACRDRSEKWAKHDLLWRIQNLERECGITPSSCLWADLLDRDP